jgi:CheY-like chemotaxis protein
VVWCWFVEDDFDVLNAIAAILEDAGYEVLRAANGFEALVQLGDRKGHCDLILLDLLMPVMNGWDFRHKQKQTPAFAGIPVVLMSAGAHLASVSGDLDADGYLTKPVEDERPVGRGQAALPVTPAATTGSRAATAAADRCVGSLPPDQVAGRRRDGGGVQGHLLGGRAASNVPWW